MIQKVSEYSELVANRFERINRRYIKLFAKHIKKIGKLTEDDIFFINQLTKMGTNISMISKEIAKASELTYNELLDIYKKCAKQECLASNVNYSEAIDTQLKAMAELTKNTFMNLSQTSLKSLKYQEIVDEAITARVNGLGLPEKEFRRAFNKAMKSPIAKKSSQGVYVEYASGAKRRLDSVIRMNIMQGFKQTQDKIRQEIAKEIGADGVEIDAHGMCASDHIDVQGKQFTIKQYNNLDLQRPISTCNCRHSVHYIKLGISKPTYSKDYLNKLKEMSNKNFDIFGKNLTAYEWSQAMRNLELNCRKTKDIIHGLKNAGINETEKYYNAISEYESMYEEIAKQTGLPVFYNRME